MGQESTFRWALLVVVVIMMMITAYHRIQAQAAGGSVSRREEGFLMLAMRSVIGLSLWVAIIAYLVSPGSMAWSALPVASWLRWGGVGLGLLACGLLYWTASSSRHEFHRHRGHESGGHAGHRRTLRLGTTSVLRDRLAVAAVGFAHHGQLVRRAEYFHFCVLRLPCPPGRAKVG